MSQKFISIIFGLVLIGAIILQPHLLKNKDVYLTATPPVQAGLPQNQPGSQNESAALPFAVKLPDIVAPPFVSAENNAQFLPIRDWNTPSIELKARAALAADFSSDRLFYQKNIDEPLPIASLTKLMTALVVLENYDLDGTVKISKEAVDTEGNEGGLVVGEDLSVKSLLKIMLIDSSNDAAVALAENIGLPKFVGLMNQKARDLGMSATKFNGPIGLDEEGDLASAADLLKLVKHIFLVWPGISDITRMQTDTVFSTDGKFSHQLKNTNKLLDKMPDILGGKTGTTDNAGECLIVYVQLNEKTKVITIVLGSSDRFAETEQLIDWLRKAYIWK